MILNSYLNKRNSTKSLTDSEFEELLPILAQELETVNFLPQYTDEQLKKDWKQLCNWTTNDNHIASTSRIGMKLCEHFCHNFYDIEDSKGVSFKSLWKAKNLEKVLKWNRKSHSTPYLSELKRGIYFCHGLTKNTMYRPQMMKMACMRYNTKTVLDPCACWGGRMLGAVSYGAHYIAFEPNTETYNNLKRMVDFLGIGDKVTLICDDACNMMAHNLPKVDMVLTSPPYFDLEVYSHEETQSINRTENYRDWANNFLKCIIDLGVNHLNDGGVSCWNVGKVKQNDMNDDVYLFHTMLGFEKHETLSVLSSKRQSNQTTTKNAKSSDDTVVYKKS